MEQVLLKRVGKIDPISSEAYGYEALRAACLDPDAVIPAITASGLRGRGGAGFPTGSKWAMVKEVEADQKYIVCNADEGKPGTNKDRVLLCGDPHAVLEGMAIAGIAVGADQGVLYIRAEYPYVHTILRKAIQDAEEHGFLGENIMGTGKRFFAQVRTGQGAYICGEETALLESIEGKRGETRTKPPYPTTAGLWGKPTVINNVETMACVPVAFQLGADYKKTGTEKCPGTKLFTVSGHVNRPGVYEAPHGITIGELLDMAGGMRDGKAVKAVQTGGCSGPIVGADKLSVPMTIEDCAANGCTLGTGDLMFLDDSVNFVDLAHNITEFYAGESCGKCIPCRWGLKKLTEMLADLLKGTLGEEDIPELEAVAQHASQGAFCPLGAAGPAPLLSILQNFRADFAAGIGKGGA